MLELTQEQINNLKAMTKFAEEGAFGDKELGIPKSKDPAALFAMKYQVQTERSMREVKIDKLHVSLIIVIAGPLFARTLLAWYPRDQQLLPTAEDVFVIMGHCGFSDNLDNIEIVSMQLDDGPRAIRVTQMSKND